MTTSNSKVLQHEKVYAYQLISPESGRKSKVFVSTLSEFFKGLIEIEQEFPNVKQDYINILMEMSEDITEVQDFRDLFFDVPIFRVETLIQIMGDQKDEQI